MDAMLAGFRADWTDANGGFTLQGSASQIKAEPRGFFGPFPLGRVEVSQANVLGRWSQLFANGSDLRVQAYLDYFKREDPLLYKPEESVFDIEFQHGIPLGAHRIMWGAGYRHVRDDIQPGLFFGFVPPRKTLSWANVFAQDEVALADKVTLTFGARVEHNDFTGTELLPSARLAWQMNNEHLLWTAASRAVRAPARLDRDLRLPPTPPYAIAGGPDFESEVANVFELGYRGQLAPALSYSVTAFYQDWDKLRSGQLPPDAHLQNMIHGNTSGIEAWATWQPLRQWRLSAGVTTLHKDLRLRAGSTDPSGPRGLGNDPGSQWMFRSSFDLPYRQEFDVMVRRVAELPQPVVPAYTAVDLRYGWHINDSVEISAVVRNLFDAAHPEFNAAPDRSEIARSMLVQLRWSL
jgi:iron complex outermembrane receptor protein